MVAARLLFALLAMALLATTATSAPAAPAAPSALHGFLFRADEPVRHEFARTPSFAWRPVASAVRYEFELSTSDEFRENGLIFANRELKTPVASVTLTLPWVTGSPYSLYARVRAVLRGGAISPWSAPFGFNMRQAEVPKPLPSFPGVLRWTPIEGAAAYEVWLIDANKFVTVYSNVLDEREFFTFHGADEWTSKVRWRIRSARWDVGEEEGPHRTNGIPATSWGPWSPVYESTNPPVDTGSIRLVGTVADVVAKGKNTDPAHRLMPAFVFSGTKGLDGKDAELFRVYVFTDSDCVNRVYASAVVGSPAYAPRPWGPLALPRDTAGLTAARSRYLGDGEEGTTYSNDGEAIAATESLPQATPTIGLPATEDPAPTTPTPPTTPSPAPTPDEPSSQSSSPGSSIVKFLTMNGEVGAPIDLWDTNWPQGGYYWTVVPVDALAPVAIGTTVAGGGAAIGATSLPVTDSAGFSAGDVIQIGNPSNQETATVTGATATELQLATALKQAHGASEPVTRTSGNLQYRDRELPQETCASGRVMRFGKNSEPTLVSAGAPFASGLSPRGRLTSASTGAASFYGSPLVAWTPALSADGYHVQWSKTKAPFKPESVKWKDKGSAAGFLTFGTSALLPLRPGTWWYRVRGLSFQLPTNAQFMGWSEPARLVVAKPTFAVSAKKKKKR